MRVLVIDDDKAFLGMVCAVLQEDGHAVVTATDGASGLVCAAQQHPDAIILDLLMPISDGNWFARAYARQPGSHAPIIIVSARAEAGGRQIENAVAYLRKPFELDQLLGVLDGLARPH